jgi:hypothetical protein
MSSQNDNGFTSMQASGAISAFRVVTFQSDGTITAAVATRGIGVTQQDISDASYGSVKLWTAPGTFMIAVTGTAITPASTYSVVTGGYIGTATGTSYPAYVLAHESGVASNGIVLEFNVSF